MQQVLSLAPSDSSLAPSDSELESRARSLLRWKIQFNSVHVAAVSGHVTLSGEVISALDRETAEQTIRRLRGVVGVTNCIHVGRYGGVCVRYCGHIASPPRLAERCGRLSAGVSLPAHWFPPKEPEKPRRTPRPGLLHAPPPVLVRRI